MVFRLVLLPGDGIGPEVVGAAVTVLQRIERRFGHQFDTQSFPIGGVALASGDGPLPAATREACLAADAVLLGAVGDARFDSGPRDRKPETGLLELRRALGVYANLRPARVWPSLEDSGPLKRERVAATDILIVRELTGGLYFGEPRGIAADGRSAVNTLQYCVEEIERVADVAFDAARKRRARVTSVDKANVLETSQLWRTTVSRLALRYPDVKLDHMYVDACAMALALDPPRFDVIVTENLFGDILSDEAGAIVGSLGLLPSASIGGGHGLYEPVHGSAPDLAGRDVANPIGTILSAAMLLRHSLRLEDEARAIERAVGEILAEGHRTADLRSDPSVPVIGCAEMAHLIAERC